MTGQPTPRSTNCSGSVTNSSPSPTGAACFRSRRRPGRRSSKTCRSEEHTSELQSLRHLVCRLLLEKKKKNERTRHSTSTDKSKWTYRNYGTKLRCIARIDLRLRRRQQATSGTQRPICRTHTYTRRC